VALRSSGRIVENWPWRASIIGVRAVSKQSAQPRTADRARWVWLKRRNVTKVLAVRRGDVVENGESSRSSSEVDPSLNWHNIEIGSMFAACCKTDEIGSPLLVHFPESVLLIPRREQGAGL
jgi:hypothetical protein